MLLTLRPPQRAARKSVTSMAHQSTGYQPGATGSPARIHHAHANPVCIAGSGATRGSRTVASEDVDRAFGMPPGKLRRRAGIESLAYVAEGENELSLGTCAAQQALQTSGTSAGELDWIIA